ncbi:hypothetical protein C6Y62_13815 [Hyphomicrobium sulfonivorans]|nr:hypothetical protein [Hyphomicrobium sulfonivorans]
MAALSSYKIVAVGMITRALYALRDAGPQIQKHPGLPRGVCIFAADNLFTLPLPSSPSLEQ